MKSVVHAFLLVLYPVRGVEDAAPYKCASHTQKPVETVRFQPVLVRLQELESWTL